jgi:hypothetical protein
MSEFTENQLLELDILISEKLIDMVGRIFLGKGKEEEIPILPDPPEPVIIKEGLFKNRRIK